MKYIQAPKDPWHVLVGEDGPPVSINAEPHLLLDLAQWHAARSHWPAGMPVGLKLGNDQDVEQLTDDLSRLSLVVLHFPKWTDGRAYTQARLLRARYHFEGEVRATGEVVVDMMPLLARNGFDAVALRADQSIDIAEQTLGFFGGHYQGDANDNRPLFALPPGSADKLANAPAREFVNAGAAI
jgi:uncharacterized protein (DUF934 family)